MATLPRQVQQQLAQADATLAGANAPPPPADPATLDPPPAPPPPADPIAAAPNPPAPAPATPPGGENWEHKYKVLQGMFNQASRSLRDLQGEVAQLKTQPPAPAPAPTEPPRPVADPKDVEAFGLDMVSMVQRVAENFIAGARQGIEQRFAQIDGELRALKQKVQGTSETVALTAEQQFFKALGDLVPSWPQINQMPEFLAYLNDADPLYGIRRQAALDDAQAKFDAHRAANVFKAFIATLPEPIAAPPLESPSPRGAASAPPPPPPDKPVYTQAQVTTFYDNVRRGHYRGNQPEQQRLTALYDAAMSEGRIR